MFGSVSNQVSGLGSSLGSWFKKDNKEGEEQAPNDGSKEEGTNNATTEQQKTSPPPPEKPAKSEDKDDAASNHSGATEGADSNPPSDHEDEANGKAGFASGLASFNLSGVSSKASASAKSVGSFFGSAFSKASASVKEAGSRIKETVEKTPILSEFNKEQEAFIAAKGGKVGEALPPWVGYPQEEKLKEEITSLATERKNFVRNPPTGVIFEFDLDQFLPVAQATLAADPGLEKMRFELVPKVVTEEVFWRNYFYRVGLIRQSTELSSLEQPQESAAPNKDKESKKEEDWEAELREELGEFEVVEGEGRAGEKDEHWEEEIQNMIDEEDRSPDLL